MLGKRCADSILRVPAIYKNLECPQEYNAHAKYSAAH
jgi:hypothetical protein